MASSGFAAYHSSVFVLSFSAAVCCTPAKPLHNRLGVVVLVHCRWSSEPDLSKFRPVAIDVRWTGLFTAQNVAPENID